MDCRKGALQASRTEFSQGNKRALPLLRDHIRIGDEQGVALGQGVERGVLLNADPIPSYQMIKPGKDILEIEEIQ